jgi:hypothetical protein
MSARRLLNDRLLGYPIGQVPAADGAVLVVIGVIPDNAVTLDRDRYLLGVAV